MEQTTPDGGLCGCKVGRMIASYDLADLNEQLVAWWTDDDANRSLRELAEHFNQALLAEAMDREGMNPLEGEVANVHRLLTDDDVSRGMRTQTRRRLERQGVDVDDVLSDFVSYQSIYRHLTECLDVEYEQLDQTSSARRKKGEERIYSLKSRTEVVTRDTLDRLARNDAIALEDFDVFVDVSVSCLDCRRLYTVDDLIENEGCDCQVS